MLHQRVVMRGEARNIFWEGPFSVCQSLALVNRKCGERLINEEGIALTTIETALPHAVSEQYLSEKLSSASLRSNPASLVRLKRHDSIWVSHLWPPRSERPPQAPRWITMLAWEYSMLPGSIVEALALSDEIWVNSEFTRQSFIRSGLPREKIHRISLGFDPHYFSPEGPKLSLPEARTFRFLFVGGTIYRKGIDLLLEAYQEAFGPGDDVSLVVKDIGNANIYSNQSYSRQIIDFQRNPANPHLIYLPEFLTEAQMGDLYRACDAAVFPYRGEGFNLPALEACASGLPVIATGGGPTDDFLPNVSTWSLDARPLSVGSTIYQLPCAGESFLFEPDRNQLAGMLRDLVNLSPPDRIRIGALGAMEVREQFTWDHTFKAIAGRIGLAF